MSQVATVLPPTAEVDAPPVLLPYQARWIEDGAQVKIAEKSRRTGFTWGEAADDVLIAASEKAAGGQNCWYIGYNLEMAKEYVDACAMWARAFNRAAAEIEEGILDDEDKQIRTYIIRFDSGHRITALSSRPSNLRGKQGVVIIDEAAFHEQLGELLKAAMALLIWGGKVRIISTHDGDSNPFNELILECRAGKRPYSVHRLEFRSAVEEGLYRRVCLRLGKPWTQAAEDAWVEEVYAFYSEDAAEELDVIPSSGEGAFLPRSLIEGCMDASIPVLRLTMPADFAEQPKHLREQEIEDWCQEHLAPLLAGLEPHQDHVFGSDFARSGDVAAIWPLAERRDLTLHTPFVVETRRMPFDQQKQILFFIVDRLPRFRGGALDARGNGQYLAEAAMQEYGAARILQVMASAEWYRDHMPRFRAHYEDKTIDAPRDADVLADLRAIKKERGIAKVPDNARYKGADGLLRHGDAAIAQVLATCAAATIAGGEIAFEAVPDKLARWDAPRTARGHNRPRHDDDARATLADGGAW